MSVILIVFNFFYFIGVLLPTQKYPAYTCTMTSIHYDGREKCAELGKNQAPSSSCWKSSRVQYERKSAEAGLELKTNIMAYDRVMCYAVFTHTKLVEHKSSLRNNNLHYNIAHVKQPHHAVPSIARCHQDSTSSKSLHIACLMLGIHVYGGDWTLVQPTESTPSDSANDLQGYRDHTMETRLMHIHDELDLSSINPPNYC